MLPATVRSAELDAESVVVPIPTLPTASMMKLIVFEEDATTNDG
jgi:hypothetical protein